MYTLNTPFLTALVQQTKLLTLQKSDCDLFIILQANTITYQQLYLTGIHGSITGSRLSLKRLESNGYLLSKSLGDQNHLKYYYISSKGKERLQQIFPSQIWKQIEADFERHPPSSPQQLPHRISTNDFYYSYLSSPYAELVVWQIEKGFYLLGQDNKTQLPRCDGYLGTASHGYYIEQDNGTQSDAILENKLKQYLNSDLFTENQIKRNSLVFSLYSESKSQRIEKPSFSVYRILLKTLKIWKLLNQKMVIIYTLSDFVSYLKTNSSLDGLMTAADQRLLKNLTNRYKNLSFSETEELKKRFLHQTDQKEIENKQRMQDSIFWKRIKQKFYSLVPPYRFLQGMHVYVVPNHRLMENILFVMWEEYHIPDRLLCCFFYLGIASYEWKYFDFFEMKEKQQSFIFRNCFCSNTKTCIICEDVANDLGARERVRVFLKKQHLTFHVVLMLLVNQEQDAFFFYQEVKEYVNYPENRTVVLCFLNKSLNLLQSPENSMVYQVRQQEGITTSCSVLFDYESLTGDIHTIERMV